MSVYMTKVWGFGVPCGPLQFSTSGWRDRAREELRPGDLVVLVGTKEPPTADEDQGRLLGIMEPTTEPVMSLDFPLQIAPHDFTADNEYRWPFALLNKRAWKLPARPLLEDISSRRFTMDAALGIVPLTSDEADRVRSFESEEVPLLTSSRIIARTEGYEAARRRNAPAPTTKRDGVMHLRKAAAYTYAMEIQGCSTSAFKIGWAFNHRARVRQFNLYALPELGGVKYRVKLTEFWDTARQAFKMEQELLRSFDSRRHRGNREVIQGVSYKELESAWSGCVLRLRRS